MTAVAASCSTSIRNVVLFCLIIERKIESGLQLLATNCGCHPRGRSHSVLNNYKGSQFPRHGSSATTRYLNMFQKTLRPIFSSHGQSDWIVRTCLNLVPISIKAREIWDTKLCNRLETVVHRGCYSRRIVIQKLRSTSLDVWSIAGLERGSVFMVQTSQLWCIIRCFCNTCSQQKCHKLANWRSKTGLVRTL